MPKLESATLQSVNSAPLGPGVLIANLTEFTPTGVASAITGDTTYGFRLGAMTSAPSVSIARETIDLTENYVGINAMFKGATQIMRTDITLDVELAELTHKNLKLVHPGLTESNWVNDSVPRKTFGTGNSALSIAALTAGTTMNTATVTITAGTGVSQPIVIAVTGTGASAAVAITTGTSSGSVVNTTALELVNALNANTSFAAQFQAGLPITSDGSGVVAASASSALSTGTAGVAGTKIGVRLKPTGVISNSDYLRNIALVLEGKDSSVRQIWRISNPIQTDDIDYEADDEGNVSAISATFTGHVGSADRDQTTGIYLPPYEIYNLDVPVTA